MTPNQLRAALEQLELSQVGAAAMLGISPRAVRNYLAEDRAIPTPTAKLIRLALTGKVSPDDIRRA